jgi:hypothetical protein
MRRTSKTQIHRFLHEAGISWLILFFLLACKLTWLSLVQQVLEFLPGAVALKISKERDAKENG